MISLDELQLETELREQVGSFCQQVADFRAEGPLDSVALAKLEEYFKASHIYHSAGIEGNRLTLQETAVVLAEGLDITGKPLKDSVEVRNLGAAFDFLRTLADSSQKIREADIRSLHSLLIGEDRRASPGEYRKIGVVITGAEHRPPEPLEVPTRMTALVDWLNTNFPADPIVVSTIAHHELAAIHPFVDGNGRVSRLLMNLILLRRGYPICNIRREDRPEYYEALSFADVGVYDALAKLILSRCTDLFAEYVRIRTETKRMEEWAQRWGTKEAEVLLRRESREFELWLSRIRQVELEFQKAAELLDDRLEQLSVQYYDYKNAIGFERYQKLLERGSVEQSNAFSLNFDDKHRDPERFMFRYFRNYAKFRGASVIPLELTHFDRAEKRYERLDGTAIGDLVRLREIYFAPDGEFVARYYNIGSRTEVEKRGGTVAEAVQWFYDDVLRNMFQIH